MKNRTLALVVLPLSIALLGCMGKPETKVDQTAEAKQSTSPVSKGSTIALETEAPDWLLQRIEKAPRSTPINLTAQERKMLYDRFSLGGVTTQCTHFTVCGPKKDDCHDECL